MTHRLQNMFVTPGIFRELSIHINAPGSRSPLHRFTQCTADILSPRIRILSTTYCDAILASTVDAHAVTIMARGSKTLMGRSSLPLTWARRRFRVSSSKSILHHNTVSKPKPSIASPDASLMSVREWEANINLTAERLMYLPHPDPSHHPVSNARTNDRRGTRGRRDGVSDASSTASPLSETGNRSCQACMGGTSN